MILIGMILLAIVLYQVPSIHNRLAWRVIVAQAYVRGVLDPVEEQLPTPRVVQAATDPSATPTPALPTATAVTPANTPTRALPTATPTITPTPTPLPPQVELPAPAYDLQDINNCGPATLSMYLRFYGWEGDQQDVADQVKPVREDRNVNVEELDNFVRNRVGWLRTEYRVGGNTDLLRRFLAAGIPVMIEETFIMAESYWPNDDRWAGHYLLVTGYDDDLGVFTAQDSFVGPNIRVSYRDLNTNWHSFNHVFILVFRPDQEETVKAILGEEWDKDVNRQRALERSKRETEDNPLDPFAWFNLGTNLIYFDRDNEAAAAYDQARTLGLPQRMLRYQFGPFLAYFHSLRTEDLITLTEYALKITPNSEEAMLWQGWGRYREGDKAAAISLFWQALAANSTYADAQYALDFVNNN